MKNNWLSRRSSTIIVLTSLSVLVLMANLMSQAQPPDNLSPTPGSQSDQLQPTTKVPLGTKKGLEELKSLLDASEATNSSAKRRVVISIPKELPEFVSFREAGALAIREFFLIADKASLNLENFNPSSATDLESSEGTKALLPNGGSIRLKIRKLKQGLNTRSIGEIRIQNHGIFGYEDVKEIEFITQ
jgi:hypothetical protein